MRKEVFGRPVFHFVLISLLGVVVYSNSFDVPFQFDDIDGIIENPAIKKLSKSFLMMRQASYLTFAFNYSLSGKSVYGYHVVNLLIHIITAILVYWMFVLTFRTPVMSDSSLRKNAGYGALLSSFLFVCHPIQTQAVTYIVQRFTTLAAMFYILALIFYTIHRLSANSVRAVSFYVLTMFSAILAMKSKETAFTLPVAIVMYDFMFFRDGIRKRLLHLGPLFLMILIIPLTLVSLNVSPGEMIDRISEATRVQTEMSRLDYLFTEFRVITTYIRLLFLPVGQNVDYDYPLYHSLFDPQVLLSFVFLLGIFCLGAYMLVRPRGDAAGRLVAFGIFWFFLTLSVESSIIPIVDVIFEHRVYLPSVGAFSAVVVGAHLTAYKLWNKRILNKLSIVMIVIIVVLSSATYARNKVWQSRTSLWEDVVSKSPKKARGHNNLGNAYLEHDLLNEAIEQYRIASKLSPTWVDVYYNIGAAYELNGQKDKAINFFEYAATIKPDYDKAYTSLGNIFKSNGNLDKAIEYYLRALEVKPYELSTNYNLGVSYFEKGDIEKAKQHLLKAEEIDPFFPRAYHVLGDIYKTSGMYEKAIEQYEKALNLDYDSADVRNNLGLIYGQRGEVDKAIEHFEEAVRLNPKMEAGHQNLGNAYLLKGDSEKAVEQYKSAIELNPDSADTYFNLNLAYRKMGQPDEAQKHLEKAINLNPALGR